MVIILNNINNNSINQKPIFIYPFTKANNKIIADYLCLKDEYSKLFTEGDKNSCNELEAL